MAGSSGCFPRLGREPRRSSACITRFRLIYAGGDASIFQYRPHGKPAVIGTAAASTRTPDPLLRSAYSLMVNAAVTAGLGIAFWIVAARLYEPVVLGRGAALIAVMMELSTICQLNMANAIMRFLPSLDEEPLGRFSAHTR